ncbi:MAG TPA: M48 family metalloprotease [Pyrinomonadaceae bacterium]|jgi:Zn-dependent protease with chaperone function
MYYTLIGCLALAAFLSLNVLGTLAVTGSWVCLRRHLSGTRAQTRAGILFGLRVLPPVFALTFVVALLIPAYLLYEPHPAAESVGLPLLALAALSLSGIALAAYRAINSWLATKGMIAAWLRRAEPIRAGGVEIPAYRLSIMTPVLAVVGMLRPRLFVASQVLDSLSPREAAVALAHERGHLLARDTLKRAVMNFCRHLLLSTGIGQRLDREWAKEAERAADEYAARAGAACALDLAAALIKIARLMPEESSSVMPAGAFLLEGADEGVAGRVRRLTEMASARTVNAGLESLLSKTLALAAVLSFVLMLALAADRQALEALYTFNEWAMKLLT